MKKRKALQSKFTELQCSETYLFCLFISKTCSFLKRISKTLDDNGFQIVLMRFSVLQLPDCIGSVGLKLGEIWYKTIAGWEITVWKEPEFKRYFYSVKQWDSCLRIYAVLNWNGLRIFPVVTLIYVPVNSTLQGLINCSLLVLLIIII